MSDGRERSAWRFLGLAVLFVAVNVGLIALGVLLFPGSRFVGPTVGGLSAVFLLFLYWRRDRRGRDHGTAQ